MIELSKRNVRDLSNVIELSKRDRVIDNVIELSKRYIELSKCR